MRQLVWVTLRNQAAILERHGGVTLGRKFLLDDQIRITQSAIDVANVDLKIGRNVVGRCVVKLGRSRLHACARIGDRA
jgi:hypothetical protein